MEQAAGLLAMHCVIRGQTPLDYLVMVQAPDQILKGLTERAEKLLQSWHLLSPVQLTRREEHVLNGVLRGLSNKEIAALVNLSERTVKFHVSNLFSKFHVRCRAALAREAARHTIVPVVPPSPRTSPIAAATPTLQMRPQVKQY
jgi:DNA-binding NarL/FixJ family response regulator